MDICLERILSLIPRKPNGDYVHGAKREFAQSIGLKSGNVISDWVSGRSDSYVNYLYEISAKYGVSVAWLKGETDEKSPSEDGEMIGLLEELKDRSDLRTLLDAARLRSPEQVNMITEFFKQLKEDS